MFTVNRLTVVFLVALLLLPVEALAVTKRKNRPLTRAEIKKSEARLKELGYPSLTLFQKWEDRKVTGRLNREEFEAIMNAEAPQPRDPGYVHVEIDVDRQMLLVFDEDGAVRKILPVSTGSNRQYNEKGMRGLAYTPRGRFRIYGKIDGWRKSPLGLLYYPNYFSDGLAIHGNPEVPTTPQSHGCVRIPMSAAVEMSKLLPVGTIVLIYDSESFVSAKDWAEADKLKQEAIIPD
ncbi:MAG TPA: L,D-transpeptidase [Pyrinomonadaceae bacterium]|nr:L,D-transpeptidase [Pyrinomonadaceae bacterium]